MGFGATIEQTDQTRHRLPKKLKLGLTCLLSLVPLHRHQRIFKLQGKLGLAPDNFRNHSSLVVANTPNAATSLVAALLGGKLPKPPLQTEEPQYLGVNMHKFFAQLIFSLALLGLPASLSAWEATIERDIWGVPHIKGATDADAA